MNDPSACRWQALVFTIAEDKVSKKDMTKLSIPTIAMPLQMCYHKLIQVDSAYSTK